jgi:hypothetical protein
MVKICPAAPADQPGGRNAAAAPLNMPLVREPSVEDFPGRFLLHKPD